MEQHNENKSTPTFKEKLKTFFQTKLVLEIIYILLAIILAILIFQAGVLVGFHKASFDKSWDENYVQNFGPGKQGGFGPMPSQFPNAHGTIGKIIKLDDVNQNSIVVEGQDNVEKIILVSANTHIRKLRTDITASGLDLGDTVIVIGEPNTQGDIIANFIRVLPALPVGTPTNQTAGPLINPPANQ